MAGGGRHTTEAVVIITILEARVAPEGWDKLKSSYAVLLAHRPPEIVHTYLAQDEADAACWRIITVWRSREFLDREAQEFREPAPGTLMFRAAGAEPTVSIWEVCAASV